jgi:hypothetical protein
MEKFPMAGKVKVNKYIGTPWGGHETAEPIHLPNWFLVVSATQYKKSNCFNSIRVCPIQDRNRIDLTFCFTYQTGFLLHQNLLH